MQTILGVGGAIGTPLAKELRRYTDKVRLVGRNPSKVNSDDELVSADLTDAEAVMKCVENSEVVYLTVGLKYDIKIWEKQWPQIIQNVINACLKHQCKLVFFDNVYMYAKQHISHMTESSLISPPSKKGKVRADVLCMLENAIKHQGLQALVARSADFYGRDAKNSLIQVGIFDNIKKGKRAMLFHDIRKIHSFTYIPDAVRAVAFLGNNDAAYGEIWHLPTSKERLTMLDFLNISAGLLNEKPKYFVLKKWMLNILGTFIPLMKELVEMQYQNEQDYFFDSSKVEKRFGLTATDYKTGIRECLI